MRRVTRLAFAILLLGAVAIFGSRLSAVQAPAAQTPPAASAGQAEGGQELYHVHFVKAAPGKLLELIDAYLDAPADPQASAPPVILRHRQGDDWNLMVLRPLGAEATVRVTPPSADRQQFLTRLRPLGSEHNDTFAIGPAWSQARKLVLGDDKAESSGATGMVYVVSVFRSVPGHRDQLEAALRKLPADQPPNTLTLQHVEGGSWEFLQITRYDSWAAFGESEQKLMGQAPVTSPGAALSDHLAEHHDTLAVRVTRTAPARQP